GWSGGADSTALLLALRQAGYQVQAWHVDHGWRDSSKHESMQLAEKCAAWGIDFRSVRLAGQASSNREAEARKGRYAQFKQWAQESGVTTLCLAHHLDDQAETVCMRLLQGAGPGGCRGMRRERQMGELRIVRPLLHVSAQDLRQTLRQAGIDWFEDPSNADMSIWRNRIRQQLFPGMEKAGVSPAELFLRWQKQADDVAKKLDQATLPALHDLIQSEQYGICLPWQTWTDCSPAIRARLLQQCMARLLGEGVTPGRRHIELVELWTEKSGRGGLDLSRCRLYKERDHLHLKPVTSGFARKP
ncbi:MAG: tRNA lysidine(34) synthetase TilS, partial [Mariprofundus sp.]